MSHLTVADLTLEQFRTLIRETVTQTLLEMFGDPDEGLELRDDFRAKLQQSLAMTQTGGKTIPAAEVAAKLGLTW
ncbi:MAG: hypothetical protein AB1791_18165 [Chloroflexota bacterium]